VFGGAETCNQFNITIVYRNCKNSQPAKNELGAERARDFKEQMLSAGLPV
jgi:hypothetical protein